VQLLGRVDGRELREHRRNDHNAPLGRQQIRRRDRDAIERDDLELDRSRRRARSPERRRGEQRDELGRRINDGVLRADVGRALGPLERRFRRRFLGLARPSGCWTITGAPASSSTIRESLAAPWRSSSSI
jgi:hypothetical protein